MEKIRDYELDKDEQMIGGEPNGTPTYFHVNESLINEIINDEIESMILEMKND